jgi:D-threo-aldose 1-dehydrogenase
MVTASVFNSGLLARPVLPDNPRFDYGDVPSDILKRTRDVLRVCAEFDVELPAAALQYTLRDPLVRNVIVGASSAGQLRQSSERMDALIPEEFWTALQTVGLIAA